MPKRRTYCRRSRRSQRLYPVATEDGKLVGVVTRKELQKLASGSDPREISEVVRTKPSVAYPDEPLRIVVNRMAETGFTRLPVIEGDSAKLVGIISLQDLLHARVGHLEEERRRERVLRIHLPFTAAPALEDIRPEP